MSKKKRNRKPAPSLQGFPSINLFSQVILNNTTYAVNAINYNNNQIHIVAPGTPSQWINVNLITPV